MKAAPGGQTSGAGHMGEKIPMGADGGGHLEFGSQLDAIPDTNTAPESSRQPLSAGGGMPVPRKPLSNQRCRMLCWWR